VPTDIVQEAADGGVAVTQIGRGEVRVVCAGYGISIDAFEQLALEYERDFRVTKGALDEFFLTLGREQVARHEWRDRLRTIATEYRSLLAQLDRFRASDPVIQASVDQARAELRAGRTGAARALFEKVQQRCRSARRALQEMLLEETHVELEAGLHIGQTLIVEMQFAEAVGALTEALTEPAPELPELKMRLLLTLSDAQRWAGAYVDAAATAREALQTAQDSKEVAVETVQAARHRLALARREAGDLKEARTQLGMAAQSGDLEAAIDLARVERELGELHSAKLTLADVERRLESASSKERSQNWRYWQVLGRLYHDMAELDAAEGALNTALDLLEHREPNRFAPDEWDVRADLGHVLRSAGRAGEARDLFRQIEQAQRTDLGAEHPLLVTTLDHLGNASGESGDWLEARHHLEGAADLARKSLGPMHPDYGQSLGNLGRAHLELGANANAEACLSEAVRVLAAGASRHPDLAAALHNYAIALARNGKIEEASQQLANALLMRKALFGASHPAIAESTNASGWLQELSGNPGAAAEAYEGAASMWAHHPGYEHRRCAALLNLARLRLHTGAAADALRPARTALHLARRTYGRDSPITGRICSTCGHTLLELSRPRRALVLLEHAQRVLRTTLPDGHEDRVACGINLASAYEDAGRPHESERCYREIIQEIGLSDGQNADLALAKNNLASVLCHLDRRDEARELANEAVALAEVSLGSVHPWTRAFARNRERLNEA
jgi:tetratricopeptide (TPR) repeat protein